MIKLTLMPGKYNVCLYTNQFPYGNGEQFIETEIKYLARVFQKIYILPENMEGEKRELPTNVNVINFSNNYHTTLKGLTSLGFWMRYLLIDLFKTKQLRLQFSLLLRTASKSKQLEVFIKDNNLNKNTIHYSYWFNNAATQLAILKHTGVIKHFVSRAHGYDLYEERNKLSFIPYRKFQLKHINKLFLISKDGLSYLKKRYPKHNKQYVLSYLGVERIFEPLAYKTTNSNKFTIVSCSRLVDIKRVQLIVEALALINDLHIKWIHFGDGVLLNDIKKLASEKLPNNIIAIFKGHVENASIYKSYSETKINAFINLSSSEGLPVSIMEAISYGIPVVATDVGGTKEIVNNKTGILLSSTPSIESISLAINQILTKDIQDAKNRLGIINFWRTNFNSKINYDNFITQLINENI